MKKYSKILLYNRSYLIIIIADLISRAGDILFSIALSWTIIETTKSVFLASTIFFMKYLAQSAFSLVSGVLIDHYSRKKLLIIGLLAQAVLLLSFIPFVQKGINLLYLTPLVFLLYIFSTVVKQTQNVMIPDFVDKEDLVMANSIDIMFNRVVGVGMLAVAGFLTSWLKFSTIMLLDSVTFVIPTLLLFFFLPDSQINKKRVSARGKKITIWFDNLQEGWKYIKSDSFVLFFLILLVLLNLPYTFMNIYPLAYVNKVLSVESSGYGFVKSCIFLATLLSMYIVGKYKVFSDKPSKFFRLGLFGCGLAIFFFAPIFKNNLITVIALLGIYEFFDSLTQPMFAILRGRIPSELRGRVLGVFDAVALVLVPIYTLLSGFVMDKVGIAKVGILISTLFILIGLLSLKLYSNDKMV